MYCFLQAYKKRINYTYKLLAKFITELRKCMIRVNERLQQPDIWVINYKSTFVVEN